MRGTVDTPADDVSGKNIDDKRDIDKALPGRDIGEIAHPKLVGTGRLELAVDPVQRTGRGLVADRRADRLAAYNPL